MIAVLGLGRWGLIDEGVPVMWMEARVRPSDCFYVIVMEPNGSHPSTMWRRIRFSSRHLRHGHRRRTLRCFLFPTTHDTLESSRVWVTLCAFSFQLRLIHLLLSTCLHVSHYSGRLTYRLQVGGRAFVVLWILLDLVLFCVCASRLAWRLCK